MASAWWYSATGVCIDSWVGNVNNIDFHYKNSSDLTAVFLSDNSTIILTGGMLMMQRTPEEQEKWPLHAK